MNLSNFRLPKSYKKNRTQIFDFKSKLPASKKFNSDKKQRYKQRYMIDNVIRNRGIWADIKKENQRLRRFKADKHNSKFNKTISIETII